MSGTRSRRTEAPAAAGGDGHAPLTQAEARQLFSDFRAAHALVLAVSGGPDSMALLVLAARWRRSYKRGPRLIAVTVDHGLRPEAAAEARAVKAAAKRLAVEHHTLRWSGAKPSAGLPSAARAARYNLLARLAREFGTVHVLTGHTRDDQAETVLMRMARGSGLAGLAGMARKVERGSMVLVRPFLDIPKSRLVATVTQAGVGYAQDPSNHDPTFTRPRLRALMPALAREGCDARNLGRLATRLARANTALEGVVDVAERALLQFDPAARRSEFEPLAFFSAPEEIRLRLLIRAINRAGTEGTAELGKAEGLLRALDAAWGAPQPAIKQTLAGAVVSFGRARLAVAPAPPRRTSRRDSKP